MSWRLAVIGNPVAHSLSPRLHAAALAYVGLDGESQALEVDSIDDYFEAIVASHDALSVTMPLKEQLVDRCDDVDEIARRTGSVNSLLMRGGRLLGRSTDGAGFLDALGENRPGEGSRVLVLGSGGSAKAIVDACSHAGSRVDIVSRNATTRDALAARYPNATAVSEARGTFDVVVNTTPVREGETRADCPAIVPSANGVAVDIVYSPARTSWMDECERGGFRTMNGVMMLVHQARHQFRWWFDDDVPVAALMKALD